MLLVAAGCAHAGDTPPQQLAPVTVYGTPLAGPILLLPAASDRIDADAFRQQHSPSVIDAMQQRVPGLSIANATGNGFEPDVQFRGFVATPLTGTPEGLAVYQDGVRINEAFGDNVHWDFIPPEAIQSMNVVSNDPLFGLNALGGAVVVRMKNGFEDQGIRNDSSAGSYGRVRDALQWGGRSGHMAGYLALDVAHDDGFRDDSGSTLRRLYGNIGWRGQRSELHLDITAADNDFQSPAGTPIDLLNRDRHAVFTTPQSDALEMGMLGLHEKTEINDTLTLAATGYFRHFSDRHVDGNDTDVQRCGAPFGGLLCFGDDHDPADSSDGSGQLADRFPPGTVIGEIDRNATLGNGWGASLQLSDTTRGNTFVAGASLDAARTRFRANSELGAVDPASFVVTGNGQYLGHSTSAEGSIGPVKLRARNRYLGVYVVDTLDATDRLSLTLGGRFNVADVDLDDRLDTQAGSLSGHHRYVRFDPMAGVVFKLGQGVAAYAGWSGANRAPTPLELGCADPDRPCVLDSFLVADPDLHQVVAQTFEAGLRRQSDSTATRLSWRFGLYRIDSSNDILEVAAPVGKSFGYFANVGDTRRQGVELAVTYRNGNWSVYASYAYVQATYRSHAALNPPEGDPAGDDRPLDVEPGDRISGIPARTCKLGASLRIGKAWQVGVTLLAVGSRYFEGDESNQNPRLPGHVVANLDAGWRVSSHVQVHARVLNLFDRRYFTYGTYYDTGSPVGALVHGNNPESVTPGLPRAVYVGVRIRY